MRRTKPQPVDLSLFVYRRADGLKRRVVNLVLEVDGVLGDVHPYRGQLDANAYGYLMRVLDNADQRTRDLFPKWRRRFAPMVRNITPQPKRLRG